MTQQRWQQGRLETMIKRTLVGRLLGAQDHNVEVAEVVLGGGGADARRCTRTKQFSTPMHRASPFGGPLRPATNQAGTEKGRNGGQQT